MKSLSPLLYFRSRVRSVSSAWFVICCFLVAQFLLGLPTQLPAQVSAPSLHGSVLPNGAFQISVSTGTNTVYQVQYTADLTPAVAWRC
ncbi:MAG TPA: hypothetical protein VJA21_15320, partial [Verrucomicrobiae bacterium]